MSDTNYWRNGKKISEEEFFREDSYEPMTPFIVMLIMVVAFLILFIISG